MVKISKTATLSIILALATPSAATAADGENGGDSAPSAETAEAVEKLGADSFQEREEASGYLWKHALDPGVLPLVKRAAKSRDPEIRSRAKKILAKVRGGLIYGLPKNLAEKIASLPQTSRRDKVGILLDLLKDEAGRKVLGLIASAVVFARVPTAKQAPIDGYDMASMVGNNSDEIIALYLKDPEKTEKLVETLFLAAATADGTPSFTQYLIWSVLKGDVDKRVAKLERTLSEASPFEKKRILPLLKRLYYINGQNAKATALDDGFDDSIDLAIALDSGDYARVWPPEKIPNDDFTSLGRCVTFLNLQGEKQKAGKYLEKVLEMVDGKGEKSWYAMEILLINDMSREAAELYLSLDPPKHPHFASFVPALYRETTRTFLKKGGEIPLDHPLYLYLHGERAEAKRLLAKAAETKTWNNDEERADRLARLAALAFGMEDVPAGRRFEEQALAVPGTGESDILRRIHHDDGIDFWLTYLKWKHPGETEKKIRDIYYDSIYGKNWFKWKGTRALLENAGALYVKNASKEEASRAISYIASLYRTIGDKKKTTESLRKSVELNPAYGNLLALADDSAERERFAEAADLYAKAAAKGPEGKAIPDYLRGLCLIRAGKTAEGRAIIEKTDWEIFDDDGARMKLISALEERGYLDELEKEAGILKRTNNPLVWTTAAAAQRLSIPMTKKKEFALAANYIMESLNFVLDESSAYPDSQYYVFDMARYHAARTKALIKEGKLEEALNECRSTLNIYPLDPEIFIYAVKEFEKAGRKDLADKLYAIFAGSMDRDQKAFPKSSILKNNRAWFMVSTGRELDKAEKLAKEAVAADPNAANLDTLAAVLFHKGKREEAVEMEKRALEGANTPKDKALFEKRLKRFENDPIPKTTGD